MTFTRPALFVVAIALVAGFIVLYRLLFARRTGRELRYSNLPFLIEAARPSRLASMFFLVAWIVALATAGLALAGPRLTTWVPAKDGVVIICIDTSGSMASSDVAPTRAQAALEAAHAFASDAPAGTKIGLIAFSTSAELVQRPTSDRDEFDRALAEIPAPNGATAIGDALTLASQVLPPRGHRVVVLITDGVNNRGVDPLAAAQNLGAHHVPVYTVGIGSNSGAIIPGTGEEATIDEDALRAYAQSSGGAYARADDAAALRAALAQLGRTTTFEKRQIDASLPFAFGAMALVLGVVLAQLAAGRFP